MEPGTGPVSHQGAVSRRGTATASDKGVRMSRRCSTIVRQLGDIKHALAEIRNGGGEVGQPHSRGSSLEASDVCSGGAAASGGAVSSAAARGAVGRRSSALGVWMAERRGTHVPSNVNLDRRRSITELEQMLVASRERRQSAARFLK